MSMTSQFMTHFCKFGSWGDIKSLFSVKKVDDGSSCYHHLYVSHMKMCGNLIDII